MIRVREKALEANQFLGTRESAWAIVAWLHDGLAQEQQAYAFADELPNGTPFIQLVGPIGSVEPRPSVWKSDWVVKAARGLPQRFTDHEFNLYFEEV